MNPVLPPHAAEVMYLLGFPQGADIHDALFWRTETDGNIRLFLVCSDTFDYATADAEIIEEQDVPLLRQTLQDLKNCSDPIAKVWLPELFAARKRRMLILAPHLDKMVDDLADLFRKAAE